MKAILQRLLTHVDSGGRPLVIDGGLHLGAFSEAILDIAPEARIIGFEPDPDTCAKARTSLAGREAVVVRNAALGESKAQAEFYRGKQAATNSLMPRPNAPGRPYFPAAASLEGGTYVDVVTLDDVQIELAIEHIHLLKLDLQGGELSALRGARRLLQEDRVDIIWCEVVFVEKYEDQPMFWEICAEVAQHGFRLHGFHDIKIGPYDEEPPETLRGSQWNQADAVFLSRRFCERIDG